MTSQAVLFDRSTQQGRLELRDRDRLDLLHRMSTNDLNRLQPGEGCSTVLTTALARIIDRVIVYHRGETALMLANQPQVVRNWLQRHIFWQDKVQIRDVSDSLGQLELYGAGASAVIARIAPGAENLPLHHFTEIPLEGGAVMLIARTFPLADDGYLLIAPLTALASLKHKLLAEITAGDEALYELLRIEAGMPGPGHELTEDYIPLEAGLWDSVSFSKGCYIGQEIIARMESRSRLAKTLVALRLNNPVSTGARLLEGAAEVGLITSVGQRPDQSVIGLGFVRPTHAAPGTRLNVASAQPDVVAEVVAAPLIRHQEE
jgi:folate-binding protein YgfZ